MISALLWVGMVLAGPMQDAQELVRLGPRVAGTEGGDRAQAWVLGELAEAGYPARRLGGPPGAGVVVGCQPGDGPAFWVLAHTDVVHQNSPGAVDNAAAVGVALEVARQVRREGLPVRACFGFPDGEELGLYGSRVLQARLDHAPAMVVALDLLGQGELTAMGLGRDWGERRLRWLLGAARVQVPYAYRTFSRIFPGRERSDHAPFAAAGVPALLLLGRGEAGVYWSYHTEHDGLDRLEPDAVSAATAALVSLLRSGPPPVAEGGVAVVVPGTDKVLGDLWVWVLVAMGVGGGIVTGLRWWREALLGFGWCLLATLGGWVAWEVAAWGRPAHGSLAEPLTSLWWVGALGVLGFAPHRERGIAGGALASAWLALGFLALDATLALPWAVVALALAMGSRAWPLMILALPIPLYVAGSDLWRELVFHQVIPEGGAWWMPVRALVLWPLCCVALSVRRAPPLFWAIGLGLALLGLGYRVALLEPFEPPFAPRHALVP